MNLLKRDSRGTPSLEPGGGGTESPSPPNHIFKGDYHNMPAKSRGEIPAQYHWKLEDIYESSQAWEEDFSKARSLIAALPAHSGTLNSAEALLSALQAVTEAEKTAEKVYTYAHMRQDEDNSNAFYQGLNERAQSLLVELESASSFLSPEILSIDPDLLEDWRTQPALKTYAHALHDLTRLRAHTLTAAEERLLAMAGEMEAAPRNIYSMLDYSDIRFPSTEKGEITHGNFVDEYMMSPDRALRQEAFQKFYETYASYRSTYGAMLTASVKADLFSARARNFPSCAEAALSGDNVPLAVYDALVEAIHQRLPVLQKYMELRRRMLGVEELHMYDLYAPLSGAEFPLSYEDACELVVKGLAPLGEEYGAVLRRAFTEGWMDVYENRGKTTGAYSWGVHGVHPFVLLNYSENLDSAFTIAHELGHSLHSYYSSAAQDYVNAQYPILLAEVASTVNENLLLDSMLDDPSWSREQRIYLLSFLLEQFRTTVFRQVMFAEFERIIHARAEAGEPLGGETFEQIYLELNRLYYGENVVIDPLIGMEWARISHFYNAFYVYKYATGFSSAVAIARAIREEGAPAVERYREFLSSGGKEYPLETLKKAGVDLTRPDAVLSALDVFESALGQLAALVEEEG